MTSAGKEMKVIDEIANNKGKMKNQYRFKKFTPNSIVILIIVLSTAIAAISSTLLADDYDDYQARKARADAEWQAKKAQMELRDSQREIDRLEAGMRRLEDDIQWTAFKEQTELNRIKREQELILQQKAEEKRLNDLKARKEAEGVRRAEREKLYADIEAFTASLEEQTNRTEPLSDEEMELFMLYGSFLRSSIESPTRSELIDIIRFNEEKFKSAGGPPLNPELTYFKQIIRRDISLFNRLRAIDKKLQLIRSQEGPDSSPE